MQNSGLEIVAGLTRPLIEICKIISIKQKF